MKKKAVFLDRDGVINRKIPNDGYVTTWQEFEFLPDVGKSIRLFNHAGYLVIVVSNQRCVAKKLISEEALKMLHRRMCKEIMRAGGRIDAVYYCPHEMEPPCECRKPAPGMLIQATREHNIDLSVSWMIGDAEVDVDAGRRAGCKTARLSEKGLTSGSKADVIGSSLSEILANIVLANTDDDCDPSDQPGEEWALC